MFMHFANAPERAGHLACGFWKQTVPTVCCQDERLYLLASALGSLYEYVLKWTDIGVTPDHKTLVFAIDQCGRAIQLLAEIKQKLELEAALTACILLTYFESLQGYTRSAISHCLQGRKLLDTRNELDTHGHLKDSAVLPQLETMILGVYDRCIIRLVLFGYMWAAALEYLTAL